MTFTVTATLSVTTPNGIEEKISIPTQELTQDLIRTIKNKVSDLFSGDDAIQDADTINVSAEVISDAGGVISIQDAHFTKAEVVAYASLIESSFAA